MTRLVFGRGSRGGIIRSLQQGLAADGSYTGIVDGLYGGGTERAVSAFQLQSSIPVTGNVDDSTWTAIMHQPLPTIFERALQLTSTFEGHGFGMVQGNWDEAWLTWGIIGFTLKHGEITKLLVDTERNHPNDLRDAFGENTAVLLQKVQASAAEQEAWANSISEGAKVKEPWRSGFQRLGDQPAVQALQLEHARTDYFVPALRTAAAFQLTSELGAALCLDIHVQNGGVSGPARAAVLSQQFSDEKARRIAIANAVADAAKPQFRDDVRARKLTIATGAGTVHGETFTIDSWGLGEYAAQELSQHG